MARVKKKWIAFSNITTVPAEVLGEDKERAIPKDEPIQLPETYADYVVANRFAAFCKAPERKAANAGAGSPDQVQAKTAAEKRLSDAQAALDGKAEGDDGYEGLLAARDAAEVALEALVKAS